MQIRASYHDRISKVVMLYDEEKAVEDIKALPRDVKLHLSHVVRNGLCVVLANIKTGDGDAEKAIFEFESRWKALGL